MAKKNQIRKEDVLEYHEGGRPGKIEVIPSKPSNSQRDLSIAYSPGVAEPCKEIEKDPEAAYRYTAKGNLVAVISNGTAVLGLGDIGPLASKPVMEGKGVLFKIFADIDTFDLELDANDPELFIQTVKALAPTFGGINLEDISAPDCFVIEQRLKEELDIPIMHDDQHGTAIISAAALLNALELVGKDISKVRVVFNGAGASAVSCASLYLALGVKKENLMMLDSKGVITTSRKHLTAEKLKFAQDTELSTLADAVNGADVFVGLSRGGVLSKDMVKSMAPDPLVFALANPDPEIKYEDAIAARKDVIVATGRSDNPNQVNNVLGFPFIFRGALDVRASKINEEMKMAATYAIANLAKEAVPEIVNLAYGQKNMSFGRNYIIPKPFDPRLIYTVAPAVAQAAMDSGVAKNPITNWDRYKEELINRLGRDDKFIRLAMEKARANPQRVVFSEADNFKMLKAAQIAYDEGIAIPILLGDEKRIKQIDKEYKLGIAEHMEIIDPRNMPDTAEVYAQQFYEERKRKGVTEFEARRLMKNRDYYGPMMVKHGDADAFITGLTIKYPRAVRPLLEILGPKDARHRVAGMYIMLTKRGPIFFADTTINEEPSAEGIVDIVLSVARTVQRINLKPKVALLSYSNFGSHHGKVPTKMNKAVELLKQSHPDLIVDGEMQANFAVNNELLQEVFPFSDLVNNKPNIFIFPDLASGNISYKLLQSLGAAEAIGPILIGLDKAAHVLQMGASVREIVNIVAMAVVDAQTRSEH